MGRRDSTKRPAVAEAAEMVIQRLEERRMLSVSLEDGSWYVEIDNNQNHVITIDVNPRNSKMLRALIDNKVAGTVAIDDINCVVVDGGGGNELITNLAARLRREPQVSTSIEPDLDALRIAVRARR